MANLIGQVILGQYRVDRFIASGGMGTVYKVWDLKRNVSLAMKVLHADFAEDPSTFKYFKREANALQKLRHPNVVPFYGLFQFEEGAFILEHYINGPSLRDVLKKHPKGLPLTETLAYMQALCAALGYAHANGVVHCDIKPGNVMMDSGGHIYLADFGIARHAESTSTTIAGAGTPSYMAPEQIQSALVTPATDIYALGVLFFELLTGQRPFRGDEQASSGTSKTSGERVRYAHLNLAPPDPRNLNPNIPPAIVAILFKCLEKDPPKRYQTTTDLLSALQGLGVPFQDRARIVPLADGPEAAAPPVSGQTFSTQSRPPLPVTPRSQKKKWALLLAGGAVILVAGLCLAAISGGRFFENRNRPTVPGGTIAPIESSPQSTATIMLRTATAQKTATSAPATDTPIPEPTATEIGFPINPKDGMELVYIPAGNFIYGVNSNDPYWQGAEIPQHEVYLDSYSIYRTEVTNGMYEKCVTDRGCKRPEQTYSRTISNYYGNDKYQNYPVIYVSWNDAQAYCAWAGGRLPTEAEWEKAARGSNGWRFPWGNGEPEDGQVNMCDRSCADTAYRISSYLDNFMDVAPVDAHPDGASPYGVLDMAGNVWEWVADWQVPAYLSQDDNPQGPASGTRRVYRGGSWRNNFEEIRTVFRPSLKPDATYDTLGFRCVVP